MQFLSITPHLQNCYSIGGRSGDNKLKWIDIKFYFPLNSEKAKKQNTKFTSAKFKKLFQSSIVFRIQTIDGKKGRSR